MPGHTIRLVLDDAEIEVLEEALDLYLRARPAAADHRFDYRYRVAQGVLGALSQPRLADDPAAAQIDDDPGGRKGRIGSQRIED
jgi:hypothetical protein